MNCSKSSRFDDSCSSSRSRHSILRLVLAAKQMLRSHRLHRATPRPRLLCTATHDSAWPCPKTCRSGLAPQLSLAKVLHL